LANWTFALTAFTCLLVGLGSYGLVGVLNHRQSRIADPVSALLFVAENHA
jgi:hypothetical protein